MATYRTIASSETDPQAPITSALMKALDANVTATAEGAAGAPRIVQTALAGGAVFDLYSGGSAWVAVTDLDGVKEVTLIAMRQTTSSGTLQVALSDSNGASWATASSSVSIGSGFAGFSMILDLETGGFLAFGNTYSAPLPSGAVNAVRVYVSTGYSGLFRIEGGRA